MTLESHGQTSTEHAMAAEAASAKREHTPTDEGHAKAEAQLSLYRQMLRIRMVEEAIATQYAEQEMRCPVHLSIGQEAAAVGGCGGAHRRTPGRRSGLGGVGPANV